MRGKGRRGLIGKATFLVLCSIALLILGISLVKGAEPTPLELVIAVVGEGFWRCECRTAEADTAWTAFISADTSMVSEGVTVTWADETTAIIAIDVPALVCTSFTFVDPPWLGREVSDAEVPERANH